MVREDMAREDMAREDMAREDMAREDMAREDMACLLACAMGAKQAGLLDAHVREP
jgi:hypothetical protein